MALAHLGYRALGIIIPDSGEFRAPRGTFKTFKNLYFNGNPLKPLFCSKIHQKAYGNPLKPLFCSKIHQKAYNFTLKPLFCDNFN